MYLSANTENKVRKFSYKDYMQRQNNFLWSELKKFHPKQILEFTTYEAKQFKNIYNCFVDFTFKDNDNICYEKLTFSLNYEPTKEDIYNESFKILKKNKNSDIIKSVLLNGANYSPVYKNEIRRFLYIGKVYFNYTTIRGAIKNSFKEDYRIFILDYKPTNEDLQNEFNSWLKDYNLKFPYRSLLEVSILKTDVSSISNISILEEIKSLSLKDKNRVFINKTDLNNILFVKFSLEYTNDRNKRLSGVFLLPIATINLENNISDKEIETIVNLNRHRKVSNVKILDTTVLGYINL